MEPSDKKSPTPPYVPYKTFKNFLEKFKQGTPGRIDRDLMGSMSGAAQSQVTTALKYLGFISDNNLPLEPMKIFVVAEGDDRKKLLKSVLSKSYPFLFDGHFDLSTATASQLREAIEAKTSATGETVSRCIAFFKDAAQDAGIAVSPYITQKRPRTGGPRKVRKSAIAIDTSNTAPVQTTQQQQSVVIEAQKSLLLWGLFQRLPTPGSVWPKADRDRWTETLHNVLTLEYAEQ
jgi:hypothetical protein